MDLNLLIKVSRVNAIQIPDSLIQGNDLGRTLSIPPNLQEIPRQGRCLVASLKDFPSVFCFLRPFGKPLQDVFSKPLNHAKEVIEAVGNTTGQGCHGPLTMAGLKQARAFIQKPLGLAAFMGKAQGTG
jgi:hypothetical protein